MIALCRREAEHQQKLERHMKHCTFDEDIWVYNAATESSYSGAESYSSMASFAKEVNSRLAKRPLVFNWFSMNV